MADKWEDYLFGTRFLGKMYKTYMRRRQVHHNLLSVKAWRRRFQKAGFAVRDEVGYLSREAAGRMDIAHYQSIPSLISYKLHGVWVPNPQRYNQTGAAHVAIFTKHAIPPADSAAIFYVLKK